MPLSCPDSRYTRAGTSGGVLESGNHIGVRTCPEIDLEIYGLIVGGVVGVLRQAKHVRVQGRWGVDQIATGWQNHCDGACGEMAVAKWKNLFHDPSVGVYTRKDVGKYQVRTTPHKCGHLIVHPTDADADKFILVLSHNAPVFVLRGWMYGHEAKQQKYWKALSGGRLAFCVPQNDLRLMATLDQSQVAA